MATHTSQRLVYYFSAGVLRSDKSLNPLTPTQDQRQRQRDEHGAWLRDCWVDRGRGRRRASGEVAERGFIPESQSQQISSCCPFKAGDKHASLSHFQVS